MAEEDASAGNGVTPAVHGAPAQALGQALEALARLSVWIAWTADPHLELRPDATVGVRSMHDAAAGLRNAAQLLDEAADRAEADDSARRARDPSAPPLLPR